MIEGYSPIRASRGNVRTAKGWIQEARQTDADEQSGSRGRRKAGGVDRLWAVAVRRHVIGECYHKIVDTLDRLENNQTLLVQSGKGSGCVGDASACSSCVDCEFESRSTLGDVGGV